MIKGLEEDNPPSSLFEKLRRTKKPWHIVILGGVDAMLVFVLAKTFGGLAYDRKYLQGKHFEYFWSPGWRWVLNGMFAKLFVGTGRGVPWPVSPQAVVGKNIDFHVDDLNNFQGASHFQAFDDARIKLGRGVWIARGCALITTNHDLMNPTCIPSREASSWATIAGWGRTSSSPPASYWASYGRRANAVVTKSFPEGYCVLGGVPAKVIKRLDDEEKEDSL